MKIFVGGLKAHHQQRLRRLFPDADLVFAACEEPHGVWHRRAQYADAVIVDQSRTSHKHMQHMQKQLHAPVYYTDSKLRIQQLIRELLTHGTAHHSYTGSRRSEGDSASDR